jgi:hypothetical protein
MGVNGKLKWLVQGGNYRENNSTLPRLLMAVYTPLLRCATASDACNFAWGLRTKQTGSRSQVPRFAFLGSHSYFPSRRSARDGLRRGFIPSPLSPHGWCSRISQTTPVLIELLMGHAGSGLIHTYAKADDDFKRDAAAKLEAFIASKIAAENTSTTSATWVN